MSKSSKKTAPATPKEVADQFVQELNEILSEQTLSNEDITAEVCSLVDEWREYVKTNEIDYPDVVGTVVTKPWITESEEDSTPAHNSRLLERAQAQYLAEQGITADEYAEMDSYDKIDHRTAITRLYNQLLKETTREKVVEKFSKGPFGEVKLQEAEVDNEAEREWFREKVEELNTDLALIEKEIDEIESQSNAETASSMMKARNNARLKELGLAKKSIVARLNHYNTKLQ